MIINKDCLIALKEIPENSVDSIVTDPPYELGFMGKSWDNTGIANNVELWKECLRVLKPGGHLLAFSGTRTYHRMASAIEDAGFEVRDMVEWVYGSGFPKSLNIGKVMDKFLKTGNASWNGTGDSTNGALGYSKLQNDQGYRPADYSNRHQNTSEITENKAKEWEGWGTALKPAHEPICMARKPLAEKSVALNVLKYGTGGINIDESRVETSDDLSLRYKSSFQEGNSQFVSETATGSGKRMELEEPDGTKLGRFPANLIHDNSEEVRECFPETKSGGTNGKKAGNKNCWLGVDKEYNMNELAPNSGNASRFFKSIKKDELCSLCCLPYDVRRDTMSICNNINVNNVENSLETTQATTESTALKNATGQVNKNLVQNVKSAGNLCDLCGTSIAQRLVAIMQDPSQESTLGVLFMPEHKKQILEKCLVSFVELRGNTDTIPTMENLSLLFGYVSNVIEEYTQKCEDIRNEEKNQWKSLVYRSKASKSERNKGCEGLIDKKAPKLKSISNFCIKCGKREDYKCNCNVGFEYKEQPNYQNITKNNHPTVKPIALMEYLIKMVTPKGGTVLDPFAGSGSTLVAAKQNDYKFIGIEREAEYVKIIEARLNIKNDKLF